ncbi:MAG: hypothetical protein AB7H86_19945 [Blastocatellales bacterium]
MKLRQRIEEFDGKRIAPLERIMDEGPPSRTTLREAVSLAADPDVRIRTGATWLLKNWSENGVELTAQQTRALLATLPDLINWEARLHLCQMLPHISIPKSSVGTVIWFLETCQFDENKYLRAWAYNGFYELSRQYPAYNDYVRGILDQGEAEKSAAVRARIRNIRKMMGVK